MFLSLFVGLPMLCLLTLAIRPLLQKPGIQAAITGGLCFLGPLALFVLLFLAQYALALFALFTGHYISVSPAGLEYRFWPYRHIRCGWQEVERVGKYYFTDVIYIKAYQIIGSSWSLRRPLKWLNFSNQATVPLNGMQGWPDGELKADLIRFAPGLFDPLSGKPRASAAWLAPGAPTQDERTYAAISHAGALTIPLVVPLIFWWLERKKSAYVRFQALQALVYQVVMLILCVGILASLLAWVLAPYYGLASPNQATVSDTTAWVIVLAVFWLSLALTAILLLMLLYATAATMRAYRGEDFRYPLIGKWLKKFRPKNL
jgi:uncharacterized Tic20 family protein